MSNIVLELEEKIGAIKTSTARQTNVCTVREIGDGVARVEGLSGAMLNEMLEFPGGIVGLALNLEETEVGAIVLGDYTAISEGDEVRTRNSSRCRSARRSLAVSWIRLVARWTARARLRHRPIILWKKSPRALLNAAV